MRELVGSVAAGEADETRSGVRTPGLAGAAHGRLRFWRSPPGQPRWARPALLAIAVLAGVAYGWGMNGAALEDFYGAAARSMSSSWHDFIFGAFDPAGTVSVDKIPGWLWPQALALRIFGFHIWAIVLPQVIEGVLTVLVLYRAVRRLAGPLAGILAAAVLTTSPVTVALNRGNVADSLLILLLVLAADATSAAMSEGPPAQLRTLLLAGVWVGLAFQAKTLAAWTVLPALAAAYLLAAPPPLRTRFAHLALAGLVTAVVSLSWMSAVSLVPAHERPYVDGSQNDSLFAQVFEYNGVSRLGRGNSYPGAGHPPRFLAQLSEGSAPTHRVAPGPTRLLAGVFGRDDGWLLPAATLAAAAILIERRRASRRDPLRALVVLWGTWLVVIGALYSAGGYPNSYYVAALTPATGALCGAGLALAWRYRERRAAAATLAGALVCCIGYGVYLLQGGAAVPGWLAPVAIALGVVGALALWAPRQVYMPPLAAACAALCMLVLPGVAAALMVTRGLGPFAAPYEPASATLSRAQAHRTRLADEQVIAQLSSTYDAPIPLAADSSILAAPFILATGQEVLPIGGYQGGIPAPSLPRLERYVSDGEVRAILAPLASGDPRIAWVRAHCAAQGAGGSPTKLYVCGG